MSVLSLISLFHFVLFCMALRGAYRRGELKVQSSLCLQCTPWAGSSTYGEKVKELFS